jgi:hypothetical protein
MLKTAQNRGRTTCVDYSGLLFPKSEERAKTESDSEETYVHTVGTLQTGYLYI